ncbi:hypothetical protein BV22DRAFT_1051576 [Leucogyrophana mollusca]|uniref:Uncharacterized protein n=1 Tax=Leucogyrophana mollusca TaxID=85980 RepID=A0ACB8B0Q9_9AGAM|nr:hypothetical protein BV22DRAFT_1051576 [Leucogyrophana mollusca]
MDQIDHVFGKSSNPQPTRGRQNASQWRKSAQKGNKRKPAAKAVTVVVVDLKPNEKLESDDESTKTTGMDEEEDSVIGATVPPGSALPVDIQAASCVASWKDATTAFALPQKRVKKELIPVVHSLADDRIPRRRAIPLACGPAVRVESNFPTMCSLVENKTFDFILARGLNNCGLPCHAASSQMDPWDVLVKSFGEDMSMKLGNKH